MTSLVTTARNAIANVINTDATMQTICGRATADLCVVWKSLGTAKLPVTTILPGPLLENDGSHGQHVLVMFLGCHHDGGKARSTVEAMAQRIREILTADALLAQSLVGVVESFDESAISPEDRAGEGGDRQDLDLRLMVWET